jgi:hypothetical protein
LNRPLRFLQQAPGLGHARGFRRRTKGRNLHGRFLGDQFKLGDLMLNVALFPRKEQIHGRGRSGGCFAKGLPQQIG